SPPCDPRLHHMAQGVIGDLVVVFSHQDIPFGSWTDEAHVSLEDVPHLRDFIYAQEPENTADRGDPRVILLSIRRAHICLPPHRPQFEDGENLFVLTDPLLPEEQRTA